MKKLIISILILSLFCLGKACNSEKAKKTFRTASESSAKITIYGEKLIQANINALEAKEISPVTFQKLTRTTGFFVRGAAVYERALEETENLIKQRGGEIPPATLENLSKIFNEQVVSKFFDILREFDALSAEQSEYAKTILAGIRLAILAIQDAFAAARDLGGQNYGVV